MLAGLGHQTRRRRGPAQRQRVGHLAGPPDRCDRRAHHDHDAARTAAPRRRAWPWRPCASAAARASLHVFSGVPSVTKSLIGYGAYLPRYRLGRQRRRPAPRRPRGRLLRRGQHHHGRRGSGHGARRPARCPSTSTSPPAARPTPTRPTRPQSTPRSDCPRPVSPSTCAEPGAARSAPGGRHRSTGGLAVAADVRVGRPGSADETTRRRRRRGTALRRRRQSRRRSGRHVADRGVPRPMAHPRQRITGEQWEERFGAQRYGELIAAAVGPNPRRCRHGRRRPCGAGLPEHRHRETRRDAGQGRAVDGHVAGRLQRRSGRADCVVRRTRYVAGAGETILVVSAVDGCDALLLRTTDALAAARQPRPVSAQRADRHRGAASDLSLVARPGRTGAAATARARPPRRTAGRRAPRDGSSGSPGHAAGNADSSHLPPMRVCRSCGTTDEMDAAPVADAARHRRHLHRRPPGLLAVTADDPGGRRRRRRRPVHASRSPTPNLSGCASGARVAFTFRRLFTAGGVHDYFWKARLLDPRSEDRWPAAESLTRWRLSAWAARGSASGGTVPTDDLMLEAIRRMHRRTPNIDRARHRRLLAGHAGIGTVRTDPQPRPGYRRQAGHPGRELLCHRIRGVPQRLLRGRLGRLRHGDGRRG